MANFFDYLIHFQAFHPLFFSKYASAAILSIYMWTAFAAFNLVKLIIPIWLPSTRGCWYVDSSPPGFADLLLLVPGSPTTKPPFLLHWIELLNLGLGLILFSPRSVLDFLPTILIPLDTLKLELLEFRKTVSSVSSLSVASAVTSNAMSGQYYLTSWSQ